MHWFHIKHKVLYLANNHSAACFHMGSRDRVPKLALNENLAGRRERRTDKGYLADHPLLAGNNFIPACLQGNRHKEYGNNPNRDSHSQRCPKMNASPRAVHRSPAPAGKSRVAGSKMCRQTESP